MGVFEAPNRLLLNFVNIRPPGEEWAQDYASLDTAVQRAARRTDGRPVTQFDLMSIEELKRCPVQQEFLPKHGVEHRVWIKGQPISDLTQVTALIRSPRRGPFNSGECEAFGHLGQHLQRAMRLYIELAQARSLTSTLEQGLDLLQTGMVLLDSAGRVLFANRAARILLDVRNGMQLEHGKLAATAASVNQKFQSLLVRALGRKGIVGGGGLAIERPLSRPLIVRVAPLSLPKAELCPRTAVAVLFADPSQATTSDDMVLAPLGLSPAERRLVSALVAGITLDRYAEQAGLRLYTVRSVLRNVFAKTGTHRQSELIAMAVRCAIIPP
jgi:DNA-binding CsgD family transcriptional regulator/PAS domain-containing protein